MTTKQKVLEQYDEVIPILVIKIKCTYLYNENNSTINDFWW